MQKASKSGHMPLALFLLSMLAGTLPVKGTEKHAIAHAAQVVVVGTFPPGVTFPWFDGWHISGKITVHEVIYGGQVARQITIRFPCKWNYCQIWPPPQYPEGLLIKGLWFLQRVDNDTWEPALGITDVGSGFRNISERSYWENYIREYKR